MTTTEIVLLVALGILFVQNIVERVLVERQRVRDNNRWVAVLNDVAEGHAEELKRLANVRLAGTTEIPPAIRIPMKPDAEQRLHSQIREDTIAKGAERLMELHRLDGLPITEEEARTQAEAMLGGRSPSPG